MAKKAIITGSGGLIGSEACRFFLGKDWEIAGVDNNLRRYFFGEKGDTTGNVEFLTKNYDQFKNHGIDIRDRGKVLTFFKDQGPVDMVIHTAAQPSHDWAAKEPFTDFDVNAGGTLNLLEAFRLHSPKGVFVHCSTNKVYGDNPNKVSLTETPTRFDYAPEQTIPGVGPEGISEEMSLDHCTHSLFGANKATGDILAQEYGRYFGLNIGAFRGGCLTGPQHSAVELHGFLTYIVDCAVSGKHYNIFGYKGKQVRDQIHSFDVVRAFEEFYKAPRQGEAYNLGGTKQNAASVLEVIDIMEKDFGLKLNHSYVDKNRVGDHICYYSDMGKFKGHYPEWQLTKNLKDIVQEIIEAKAKKETVQN